MKAKMMKFNWKIAIPLLVVVVAAAVVCLILMLKGGDDGEKKEEEKLPIAYSVGSIEIPAMTAGEDEEVSWTQDAEGVYTYTGFTDNAAAAESYVMELLDANLGFSVVDDSYIKVEEVEFAETEGTVSVARDFEEAGKLYHIRIEWSEDSCVVKMEIPEGIIRETRKAEDSSQTLSEKMDYFKSLSPAVLGLEGESMEEYEIYSMSGTVIVDDNSCLQIRVCSKENPAGTNDPSGVYLLSSDGLHLYHLDEVTDTITELDIP